MRRDPFHDFDQSVERAQRSISAKFWLIGLVQLVWALGCLALLGGFLWLMGRMAGAW